MNSVSATLHDVFYAVSSLESFSETTCVIAYDNNIKPTPVLEPIIAFSVKGCSVGPQLTKVEDNGKVVVTTDREVETTISIDIYQPYTKGGQHALALYEKIATALIFNSQQKVVKSVCQEAEYDKSCQAIVVKSTFIFKETANS